MKKVTALLIYLLVIESYAFASIASISDKPENTQREVLHLKPDVSDNSLGRNSWLSNASERSAGEASFINDFINQLDGGIRLILCKYEGTKLVSTTTFKNNIIKTPTSTWTYSINRQKALEEDAIEFSVNFKIETGEEKSAGVAVAFDFKNWTLDNYVFAPAVLYGGNRFNIENVGYPPYIYDAQKHTPDMPITTTNILHLNKDGSAAKVEMQTGNLATPMLGFYNKKNKRSFLVITEQGTSLGNSGMFVEEDMAKRRISFVVSAPGVREQRYQMCGRTASGDTSANWNKGDEVSLKFKVYNVSTNNIPDFFEKVFDVRKSLSGKNVYRNVTPYSAVINMILKIHDSSDTWYEDENYAYLSDAPDKDLWNCHLQVGWGGSPVIALPQGIRATPERVRKILKCLDAIESLQTETGLFYGVFMKGKIFGDNFDQKEERPFVALSRRVADALYFGIQLTELLKLQGYGHLIKGSWDETLHKAADALVSIWERYGQIGQTINVETGEMEVYGSTAGAIVPAALGLASKYFNEDKYLEVAKEVCRYYYKQDFCNGYAGGGASEILQSPDAETPHDMAESAMCLYELTGEKEWLKIAEMAVHMLSTWTVSYDYRFPQNSDLGRSNCHATGSIFASTQNNHSAPGLYVLSGDFLLKLYRATGDKRYAEYYKDLVHNVIQYVNTKHNPVIRNAPDGYTSERVNTSDWEGQGEVGNTWPGVGVTTWETLAILTSLQNPGIYIRNDIGEILVLDHVEASLVDKNEHGVTIKVTNPTPYDAEVTVLSENKEEASKPLGMYAYLKWKTIKIAAGQTSYFEIDNHSF